MVTPPQALAEFGTATRDWFAGAFAGPTTAQLGAWEAVAGGKHALVVAPTGSGKTLAAFLWAIDRLHHEPIPEFASRRCRVLYVSPLKALAADVQRNLRSPLAGIAQTAARAGITTPTLSVGMRSGDTPASERRTFAAKPPDILVTTPESLYLILTSKARSGLSGVETVILDEIHAIAETKRGAHLALSLERLDAQLVAGGGQPVQRIGLSATVRPVEEVATFLAGHRPIAEGGREVVVVQPPATKEWDISLVVPVPDLADLDAIGVPDPVFNPPPVELDETKAPAVEIDLTGKATDPVRKSSVWPHVEERVVDLVEAHRSTLVFTNSRRAAERLTSRLNELSARRQGFDIADPSTVWPAQEPSSSGTAAQIPEQAHLLARTHHGSMSRTERLRTESELKQGLLPAVVATSSLELGIDMGAVDLVVQVGAPPSVASGLQRIGRAGHQVGAVSKGIVFPTHRGDLVPSTVVANRMRAGEIEPLHIPQNPLDVLAQQVVAALAMDNWDVDELSAMFRRAHPFANLGEGAWRAVLDMLAGRYPSEDFVGLRARIIWDRTTDQLSARPGARSLAVISGGTIPDRGMYGVFLAGSEGENQRGGKRVGELDEEMVYESRVGDTFTLGSSTWRIEEITPDRVIVTSAPGLPGRLPFWKGDGPGRPVTLGKAMGAFVRTTNAALRTDPAAGRVQLKVEGLDPWAADNLAAYLEEQRTATGQVPDDVTIVVERFRDELGDWRVVIHSPLGAKVHAPWALVIAGRLRERHGLDVSVMHSDDGIVLRLPDSGADWGLDSLSEAQAETSFVTAEDLLIEPDDCVRAVRDELGSSVMFAARFREAAARALLLPRARPGKRQPLWQQRQRSAQLLQVASQFPDFPLTLEAARECLRDEFDIAALSELMTDLNAGRVRLLEVTTDSPSPFASSLLFGYTAQFLYDDDAPLAERRAAALALDPDLLNELLGGQGAAQIADLLDPGAVERTEAELQGLAPERQARTAETLWDLLRRTGPHPLAALEARTTPDSRALVSEWLDDLEGAKRVIRVRIAGLEQFATIEDAGRLQDALGVALPVGVPEAFTELVPDPLGDLLRRHLRTHGPVGSAQIAQRFGLGIAVVEHALSPMVVGGAVLRGALRPTTLGGTGDEWCDPEVLRTLRRRSLAALRADVEPVEPATLGVFLPRWQQVGSAATARGIDGVLRAVEQLAGAAVPASALETLVLPARVPDYSPNLLDELTTTGEVLWCGHSRLPGSGGGDGMVSLHLAETAALTLRAPDPLESDNPLGTTLHTRVLELLTDSGGFFVARLAELAEASVSETLDVLWDLVWAGWVTNDSLTPLREAVGLGVGGAHRAPKAPGRARSLRTSRFGSLSLPPSTSLSADGSVALPSRDRARDAARAAASAAGAVRHAQLRTGGGRWSALPAVEMNPTLRAHALTQVLLERHGVLTKAVAPAEQMTAEFRAVYRVLRELEDRGAVRRGYFVERLGGSQFALPGAVDLLRQAATDREREVEAGADPIRLPRALLLAATDPANPYGSALAWPGSSSDGLNEREGHRPGRKAGAVVVLVNGDLVLFMERGGKTALSFTTTPRLLAAAAHELVAAVRRRQLGKVVITRADGIAALTAARDKTPLISALLLAGFGVTPSGLRVVGA